MKTVIIKYNAGNVRSVMFALERIGVNALLTDDLQEIQSADKVIFPGVGEASSAMHYLKEKKLDEVIKNLKQPTLGICLGMQLMCKHSEEGNTDCLGIMDSGVKRFRAPALPRSAKALCGGEKGENSEKPFKPALQLNSPLSAEKNLVLGISKIPQIGWNNIINLKGDLFRKIPENSFMYFVHSYYVESNANSTATTNYIFDYCSAMQKNNFYAVQFHPEKSSEAGQKILENFLRLPQP